MEAARVRRVDGRMLARGEGSFVVGVASNEREFENTRVVCAVVQPSGMKMGCGFRVGGRSQVSECERKIKRKKQERRRGEEQEQQRVNYLSSQVWMK